MDRCRDCHNRLRRERRAALAVPIICAYCGRAFDREQSSQKLCSAPCRKAWHRQRIGLVPVVEPRNCAGCSESFLPGRANAQFCSNPCRDRAKHIRRKSDPLYLQARKEYWDAYAVANVEKLREKGRRARSENPEKVRESARRWWQQNKYQYRPTWRVNNPEKHAAKQRRRTQRLRDLTPYPIDHAAVVAKIEYWGGACWLCGVPFEAIDHVKPLAAGGLNIVANLRPICTTHNSQKRSFWRGPKRLFTI